MTDDSLAILPLDEETLAPPKESRVGTVTAIQSRIGEMRNKDRIRAGNRAKIQNWIDGARPYSEAKLVELQQVDRTNFNPREAEGMTDAAKTPFYTIIFRSPQFASIQTDYGDQMDLRAQWSQDISSSYHQMLDDWDEHDYNVQLHTLDMSKFGVGNTIWPDDDNWQWEHRKPGDVLVPDRTKANIKKLPEAAIYGTFNPVDLWKKIENEKTAKAMGWFPERVKRALVKAAPITLKTQTQFGDTWSEEYQGSLRRGDVDWNSSSSEIGYYSYLVKEFDGRITECIILDSPGTAVDDNDDALLFKRVGRYECFDQVMCPFFWDVGTGDWHSVKGLGPKIFDNTMVSARLLCDTVDGARRGATMILEATDANAMESTQLIAIGGATVVQPGFKVVQQRIGTDLEGPIRIRRELSNVLQNTTAQYVERVSNEDQEPTLGQAQLNARKENNLNESSFDRFCKTLDRQHKEVVRRAIKIGVPLYKRRHPQSDTERPEEPPQKYSNRSDGKEGAYWFVRRCVEDDVPLEALDMDYICSVKATRGLGSGSPIGMDMATQGLISLASTMEERGRHNAFRHRTAFLVGPGNVDLFYPPFDEGDLPNDHVALATLENNALRIPNGEVVVTPKQNAVIHFQVHFKDASEHVQQLQQGQAHPMEVLIHLHNAGPHMRAHLNTMVGDPTRKEKLKQLEGAWLALSKIADQLQQQVDEAMQAQQNEQAAQPQIDPKLAAALAKVQGDLKIKEFKAQGDMQLKAEKQKVQHRLKDLETAHKIRLTNATASTNGAPPKPTFADKMIETMSYKDAPEDIKRQMELQAGFVPSRLPPAAQPAKTNGSAAPKPAPAPAPAKPKRIVKQVTAKRMPDGSLTGEVVELTQS